MANGIFDAIVNPAQADVLGAVRAGRQQQAQDLAGDILGSTFTGKLGALARIDPDKALSLSKEFGIPTTSKGRFDSFVGSAVAANQLVQAGLVQEAGQFLNEQADQVESFTGPGGAQRTRDMANRVLSGDPSALEDLSRFVQAINAQAKGTTTAAAGTREFEALTAGLSKEQKDEATLIKLGLSPRAVGSAIQTIADKDIAEDIGKAEATISQRKKFGEQTAVSRAKTIDKGFDRIAGISKNILNIDRAIAALDSGAGTGAVERFLPTIKAASQELRQIQGELALDVIGAVTFGALSQGELNLARDIALPTGLDEPELRDFLIRKKEAQQKLSDYFSEQIQFLDQGGTLAGFLRQQERSADETSAQDTGQQDQVIQFDAQGNIIQ